jgi:hypothetical protein
MSDAAIAAALRNVSNATPVWQYCSLNQVRI